MLKQLMLLNIFLVETMNYFFLDYLMNNTFKRTTFIFIAL